MIEKNEEIWIDHEWHDVLISEERQAQDLFDEEAELTVRHTNSNNTFG